MENTKDGSRMCEGFHKLQVEELNKEVTYIEGVDEDTIKTYEQEQAVLSREYRLWQEDHEKRVKEHLNKCEESECQKLLNFYKAKGIYA